MAQQIQSKEKQKISLNSSKARIKVNEIFYSLQGEGYWTGTPMIFVRFSGCNLSCEWCDTEHEEGKWMAPEMIVEKVMRFKKCDKVCITGGEPTHQRDGLYRLAELLKRKDYFVFLETNGTNEIGKADIDWITVSPKGLVDTIKVFAPDEVKVVYYEQDDRYIEQYSILSCKNWFIQPRDDEQKQRNLGMAIDFCLRNPVWRLSVQMHKIIHVR